MPTPDREALSAFFAIHNTQFNRCLAPGIKCDKTAIRAHSIQNSRTLDLLVIDNHVIAFRPRASATGITIDFNSVGRNEASTFTGLCPEHDRTIFAPIDRGTLDTTNRKQLFLLAYRAVTFELHAIIEKAFMVRNMYRERVKRGWDQPSELSPAGTLAKEDLLHAFITWRYRAAKFDDDLLSHNYANVESDVLVLENQKPCIAVSSLFTIEGITKKTILCVLS